jgi:hypothetical protein
MFDVHCKETRRLWTDALPARQSADRTVVIQHFDRLANAHTDAHTFFV